MRILDGLGLDDLDRDSLRAYRNAFAVHRPGHPWVELDDLAFCACWAAGATTKTGAGRIDGCRLADVWPLARVARDAFPLYFVDYQEQSGKPDSPTRWLDRGGCPMVRGRATGNDFFRRVIQRLTADLKVAVLCFGMRARIDGRASPMEPMLSAGELPDHADTPTGPRCWWSSRPAGFSFLPRNSAPAGGWALHGSASVAPQPHAAQMFLAHQRERAGSNLPKILQRLGNKAIGCGFSTTPTFDHTVLEMLAPGANHIE